MLLPLRALLILALACAVLVVAPAHAAWPDKPIRVIVPSPPGGLSDIVLRTAMEKMQPVLKQPMVLENKPGAGGNLGAAEAARAAPDGYTWFFATDNIVTINPHVYAKLPYKVEDLVPVMVTSNFQFGVVVNASHPAKTLPELIAWYRVNEKLANFGSPAPGSLPHYFGTMFARGGGVELVHVPFSGGAPLINALVGNQVTAGIDVIAPELRERFAKLGLEPTGGSAADLAATMQRDRERWAPVVKASGFRGD